MNYNRYYFYTQVKLCSFNFIHFFFSKTISYQFLQPIQFFDGEVLLIKGWLINTLIVCVYVNCSPSWRMLRYLWINQSSRVARDHWIWDKEGQMEISGSGQFLIQLIPRSSSWCVQPEKVPPVWIISGPASNQDDW